MKPQKLLGLVLCLTLLITSCNARDVIKQEGFQAEPLPLFEGDEKRYKPFLGSLSEAVKLRYTGSKGSIRVTAELWEYGVLTKTLGSITGGLQSKEGSASFENELIISIKELRSEPDNKGTRFAATVALIGDNGSSTSELLIESPLKLTNKMPISLGEAKQLSETEDAAVWGFQATDESSLRTVDFSPEYLKEAKWAVIFKVGVTE